MPNKLLSAIIVTVVAILAVWFLLINKESITFDDDRTPPSGFEQSTTSKPTTTPLNTTDTGSKVLLNVPFAAQAPFGNWSDPRQQDGCEEASTLMAMYWVQGKSLTPAIAEKEILAISDWEERTYGSYHDTSAEDTNKRILQGYFKYNDAKVRHNVSLEDIKAELRAGHAVITPMNGKALNNPYFTAGGPDRHMLIVIGYDPATKEIITHDPGTRQGRSYRYKESVFYSAMRDYATGYHEPITGGKAMIVISK